MKIHFLWLTLATSGIMLGCASNNHRTSHRVSAKFVPDATAVAKEPNTPAEQSDQLTVDSSSVLPASGYSTDQTAVSSDVIFAAVEPINSDEGNNASAVMAGEQTSLDELVSLAMANNPAIKELAATTQKAAGFRTQVGLYANPIVGYQGQQLADRGTDQHLIFAEQEFVTADKLNLNRRVQNEALRAQLQELEAQRIRVATDIRTRYYEALGFQKQLELIQEFRKLLDKGYDLAQLRLKAAEGSKIDVLQAKVQRSELDLISRQTQARYDAAWREMAAITGIQNLAPRTLSGSFDNVATSMQWEDIASNLVTTSPEYAAAQARISQAQAELNRMVCRRSQHHSAVWGWC